MTFEGSGGNVGTRQRSEVSFEGSGGDVCTRQKTHTRQKKGGGVRLQGKERGKVEL